MRSTLDTRGVSNVFLKEFRKNYLATFKNITATHICDEIINPRTKVSLIFKHIGPNATPTR